MGDMRQKGKVWIPGSKPVRVALKGRGSWDLSLVPVGNQPHGLAARKGTTSVAAEQFLGQIPAFCWSQGHPKAFKLPPLPSRLCFSCPAPWLDFRPDPKEIPSLIRPHFPDHISSHARSTWAQLPPLSPGKSVLHLHTNGTRCRRDFLINSALIFPKAPTWCSPPSSWDVF